MKSLLALGLLACSLTRPQVDDESAAVLLEADRAFCRATSERGLEGWLAWFAPDAWVLAPDGRVLNEPARIRAYYESLAFPPAGFSWAPESGALAGSGELGYTLGSWELEAPEIGGTPARGRYLSFWQRQADDSLLVIADAGGVANFRTHLAGAAGPPLEWSGKTERLWVAESGELALSIGSWTARTSGGTHAGKHLTAWQRSETGWGIAAELGFEH